MPVARSKADVMCLAVYTMVGGSVLRGFMVQTVADRLGIDFEQAEAMAIAAAEAGLLGHEWYTVSLTGEGLAHGATLRPPGFRPRARGKRRSR